MENLESQVIQAQAECYRLIKTVDSLNSAMHQLIKEAGVSTYPELQEFIAKAKATVEGE